MSTQPPPQESCIDSALIQIALTIIVSIGGQSDPAAIAPGLGRSRDAFENNLPQESQSEIIGEALACTGASTTDLESEAEDLYTSFATALVVAIVVCVCLSIIVASTGEEDVVKVMYVIVLVAVLIISIIILLDRDEGILGLSQCVRDTVRREEVYKEQYIRALNSAFCAY